jgi:hypothetical protein
MWRRRSASKHDLTHGEAHRKREITMEPTQTTEQIAEQTTEREVYEPPMLAEVGQFAELTAGNGSSAPDSFGYMG